ncbi:MAG: glycosyltransferase family 1 protein [Cyanobacteriota bacterium]|nr:glycosyltransferase family 1 protein [Cyanobacteriota bacterium]
MTVLINLSVLFDRPTGITTYANNLVPHLKPLDPTLLIARSRSGFRCYAIADNLSPAHGSRGHLRRLWWTQVELPRIYRKLQSSLIFSPVPEAPLYRKSRFVVMVHDLIPLRFPQLFARSPLIPYFRWYIPQVLAQAQHIICNSQATARDITDFWNIPAKKITPIPLAYDSNHFKPLSPKKALNEEIASQKDAQQLLSSKKALNEELSQEAREDFSTKRPYFLYIGRHDPYKNLQRVIEAFAKLGDRHCQLWIAGACDPRYTPALQQQAQELEVSDRVQFLEYVPYAQLPLLLNRAIALVFPSLWEGFGIPVLEAMACGTPVITSNCSSLPEVAGEAAILVDPYAVGEIRAAMQLLLEDGETRSQLVQLSLKRASLFSWEKTGRQTMEVLQQYC